MACDLPTGLGHRGCRDSGNQAKNATLHGLIESVKTADASPLVGPRNSSLGEWREEDMMKTPPIKHLGWQLNWETSRKDCPSYLGLVPSFPPACVDRYTTGNSMSCVSSLCGPTTTRYFASAVSAGLEKASYPISSMELREVDQAEYPSISYTTVS